MEANDVNSLLQIWQERKQGPHSKEYKIALSECIMDLEAVSQPDDDYWKEIFSELPPLEILDNAI